MIVTRGGGAQISAARCQMEEQLLVVVSLLAVLGLLLHGEAAVSYQNETTGPFVVQVDTSALPAIQVWDSLNSQLVWFSSKAEGSTLVSGIKAEQSVLQNSGDFVIKTTVLEECTYVEWCSVETIPSSPSPVVTLRGVLCDQDPVNITFQAIPASNDARGKQITHLQMNVTLLSETYNRILLTYGCDWNEGFYGFGAQYTFLNMKNRSVPIFLSEQGVGRGLQPLTTLLNDLSAGAGGTWYTTYTHVPYYLTSHQRSLALESLDYVVFRFLEEELVSVEVNNTELVVRIIPGGTPLELVESYTAYAGRMKLLPKWITSGIILGLQGGTNIVMDILQQIKEVVGSLSGIAGVWIQDWTGQRNFTANSSDLPRTALWWNWELDRQHYSNWDLLVKLLQYNNIRLLTYINPLLNNVSLRGTPYKHNYFEEAMRQGLFIRGLSGEVWEGYTNSSMADFSNPQSYTMFKDIIINNMLAVNMSGWMCDFGESVPLDSSLFDGSNPAHYHTHYPLAWAKLNEDAIASAVKEGIISEQQAGETIYFMRSGNARSPGVARLFWLGDQLVSWDNWDGLITAITGMISSGLSGFSLTHSDIGGYTAFNASILTYIRSKDLFLRWCELSAFSLIYRTHMGTLPDQNWQFNSDNYTMGQFFRMGKVFQAWGFYRQQLIQEAANNGWPVVRHLMLVFPNNSAVYKEDLRRQYMLGTEILVAPVYNSNAVTNWVFLPKNVTWVILWNNLTYTGCNQWLGLSAPQGFPLVLYRQGSPVGKQFVRNLHQLLGKSAYHPRAGSLTSMKLPSSV